MSDIEETARLLLMDQVGREERSVFAFGKALQAEHGGIDALTIGRLWTRYMGMDGRIDPTHDLYTNRRLR